MHRAQKHWFWNFQQVPICLSQSVHILNLSYINVHYVSTYGCH